MTKTLLSFVVSVKVPVSTRLLLLSLALCIVPFTLALDALCLVIGTAREKRLLSSTAVRCPAGHEVELHGGWRCSCGIAFSGSGFSPCPACGERSWVVCPCGRSVRNPLGGKRP